MDEKKCEPGVDPVIRPAGAGDLEAVAMIESVCFPPAQAASQESLARRLELFGPSFMVAQDGADGPVIGFINGTVCNAPKISDDMYENITYDPRGDYQMIFGLDVLPRYRGQGVARMLMEAMIRLAWDEGRRGLALTCREHLIDFDESFGYVNEGVSGSVHGGVLWDDMRLIF